MWTLPCWPPNHVVRTYTEGSREKNSEAHADTDCSKRKKIKHHTYVTAPLHLALSRWNSRNYHTAGGGQLLLLSQLLRWSSYGTFHWSHNACVSGNNSTDTDYETSLETVGTVDLLYRPFCSRNETYLHILHSYTSKNRNKVDGMDENSDRLWKMWNIF